MQIKIINNTSLPDPSDQLIDRLSSVEGSGTIYISHYAPEDSKNWIRINNNELEYYCKTHDVFYKTARVHHNQHTYRSKEPLKNNDTPIYGCIKTSDLHLAKICTLCKHYESSTKTCERYPTPINMTDIPKNRCGEFLHI